MQKPERIPPEDDFTIRCRKLGHLICFSYCRRENSGLPCVRIMDCWHEYFPIEELLRSELTEAEWREVFGKPQKPKVLSLVELIEQAQRKTRKRE
ncbi:MAG: hypothetical protein R6W72_01660 [Desulfurivibrionaceae bacterium]